MLWKLIKLRLIGMLSRSSSKNKNGKKSGTSVVVLCALAICFLMFGVMFYGLFGMMADTIGILPEYHWFYFALVGLFAFGISFFFTAFTAKSELFEAKDNELLLSLPIRPRTILLSRMAILIGTEYLFSLLVMLPAGLAWFGNAGSRAQLLPYIAGCLFLPLLSASLASLIGWLLARLLAKARNKSVINTVLSLLFLAVYFIVYYNAQSYIQSLLENLDSSSRAVAAWGFLFEWFGDGIASGNLLKLLGVILISLAVFAAAVILISRGFLKISSGGTRTAKRRKGALEFQSRSVPSALLRRELKRFTSSSVYMINCGLGLVLSLIAAGVLIVYAGKIRTVALPLLKTGMFTETEIALIVSIVLSFLASMDIVTAPSVSMEGRSLWIVRSAPIPTKQILHAKLRLHEYLCAPAALILSVTAAAVLKIGAVGWIVLLLVPQLFVLLSGAFGLMMNLLMPKLDWTNEAVPVKQSGAVLVTMLVQMAFISLAVGAFVFIVLNGFLSALTYSLIVVAISAAWCALCLLWIFRCGTKRFEAL